MTVVVPSAPPGPRASQTSSDTVHVRRNGINVDFAAALSESVGEANEDAGGDDATAKLREFGRPKPRTVHRLDARERQTIAAVDKVAAGQNADIPAEVIDGHVAGVRDAAPSIAVEAPESQEVPDAAPAVDPAATSAVPSPQPATPRGDSVRDVLAVLDVDLAAKRDTVAAAADLMPHARRAAHAGGPTVVGKRPDPASGEKGALNGPDMPRDVPDIGAIPVRVMRQETHFQTVALKTRHLFGMNASAPDERAQPLALAAAAKISRPRALERAPQDMPTVPEPVVEATETLAPSSLEAKGAPLGNIGQQIVDGVQRAMESPAASATPRSAPGADPAAAPAFAPMLRSIKLQLNPHSLGVVTIVLSGHDGEMRVHLEAERAETVGKVEQERGALSARLNGAGYAITELTVGRMGAADTPGRDGDQREAAARQGGHMGGQQGDTAGGGAREGAAQFADQRAGRHSGAHPDRSNAAAAAKGGSIEQAVSGVSYSGRFRPV